MWYRETLEIVRARLTLREAAAAGRAEDARQALVHLASLAAALPALADLRSECDRWRIRIEQMIDASAPSRAA